MSNAPVLSHHDTLGLQDCLRIGDLVLLPNAMDVPMEEVRALMIAGVIPPEESHIYRSTIGLLDLTQKYCHERSGRRGKEPEWALEYAQNVRAYMRQAYAVTELDALAIVNKLPYTGLSYMVVEDGLAQDACETFNLYRLMNIKQLGFLNAPPFNNYMTWRQSLSNHTRYLHSLDVYAIGSMMAHNLRLTGSELYTVQTALITHDALTPAGGDSVKDVDPKGLDEDANYAWLLKRIKFASYAKRYGIRDWILKRTIKNKGLPGEILDIADKLAYVARDIWACKHHLEIGVDNDQFGARSLLAHIERHPYMCSIWDSVVNHQGHLVFTDPSRLIAFLKVRLLMFRELYYHPNARFGEFLMSRLLVKTLYKSGELTRDMLFEMNDGELMTMIDKRFKYAYTLDSLTGDQARVATFKTVEEGTAFMAELRRSGNTFAMMDDNRRVIKTGLQNKILHRGEAIPLGEYDRGTAREITEMATMLKMVHVYYLEGDPELPRSALNEIQAALAA